MDLLMKREDFTTSYPPFNVLNIKDTSALWEKKRVNVYVHLPFCPTRCDFCYYRVEEPKGRDEISDYVELLLKEIEIMSQRPEFNTYTMESMYFGGGTPTMLSADQIVTITEAIKKVFPVTDDFEFCVEVRPGGEATTPKLESMKKLGVHRVSMGVQSLDEKVLELNGRNHSKPLFYSTYERVRKAGFDWVSCDIMSGMVGATDENWINTINEMVQLKPENIALYKMEVYYNTKLFRKVRKDPDLLISNAKEVQHFEYARETFGRNGYSMWDCFSFTNNDRYIHRHRLNVQSGGEMIGIGLSSHSYVNGYIYQNASQLNEYRDFVNNNKLPINRAYKMSQQDEIIRFITMGLKNLSFSASDFLNRFGFEVQDLYGKQMSYLMEKGIVIKNGDNFIVTSSYYGYADDIGRYFYPENKKESMLAHISRGG
ncbi:coproporphyrinogen-III oxidase family protein [Paenibacillus agilis]|uniref:coproporphyrinogen-III oxidase family protein n=1 Tax=Paenibacillus agilis TaxID=3020863 RepID=UPI0016499833|nr:coproporphyrinogen-III oxidase family protein [Paenibacillus agilis]